MSDLPKVFTSKFFPAGDIKGPCEAKFDGWNGIAFWAPIGQLKELLKQKKLNSRGIYLLRAPAERNGKPRIYIGETENLNERIKQHYKDKKKNWWTEVVAISSRFEENPLHATNRKFIERELLREAGERKRVEVKNREMSNAPDPGDSDKWHLETFLEGIKKILLLLRIKDFATDEDIANDASHSLVRPHEHMQKFEMKVPAEGGIAIANYNENTKEFIVQKGSRARREWISQRDRTSEKNHRERLFADGSLERDNDGCRFMRDVTFKTSSAAAAVIAGSLKSGPKTWRVPGTKQTFEDWLNAQREDVRSPGPGKQAQRSHKPPVFTPSKAGGQIQKFEMRVPVEGGIAIANYDENTKEFTVQRGSRARREWMSQRGRTSEKNHRERLFADGSLERDNDGCRFMRDVTFKTSSAAAAVIAGSPKSGPKTWRVPGTKQTFEDWLSAQREDVRSRGPGKQAQKAHKPRQN